MTISYVGASGVEADSITMPSHAAGDLLIMHAYALSLTTIDLPAGWNNLFFVAATNSSRIAYKVAASGSETSGTWTNSTGLLVAVYRPDSGSLMLARSEGIGSTSFSGSTIATNASAGNAGANLSPWTIMFIAQSTLLNNTSNVGTGMTSRSRFIGTAFEMSLSDSNATMNNYTGGTFSLGATSAYGRTYLGQVFEVPYPSSGGSSLPLIGTGGLVY